MLPGRWTSPHIRREASFLLAAQLCYFASPLQEDEDARLAPVRKKVLPPIFTLSPVQLTLSSVSLIFDGIFEVRGRTW